jgi:hypothetical protein
VWHRAAKLSAADRGEHGEVAGAFTQAGYLVPVSLKPFLILINACRAASSFISPEPPES